MQPENLPLLLQTIFTNYQKQQGQYDSIDKMLDDATIISLGIDRLLILAIQNVRLQFVMEIINLIIKKCEVHFVGEVSLIEAANKATANEGINLATYIDVIVTLIKTRSPSQYGYAIIDNLNPHAYEVDALNQLLSWAEGQEPTLRTKFVDSLLTAGQYNFDLEKTTDSHGDTILIHAIKEGKIEIVGFLLGKDFTIDRSVLTAALLSGHINVLQEILKQKKERFATDELCAALISVAGNPGITQAAINKFLDFIKDHPNQKVKQAINDAFMLAVKYGSPEVIEEFLTLKDSSKLTVLTLTPNEANTALRFIAERGEVGFAEILLTKGADLFAIDREGKNAIIYALEKARFDFVKGIFDYLKQSGKNLEGQTELLPYMADFAAKTGQRQKEIVVLVKRKGEGDVHEVDQKVADTPYWRDIDIARYLLEAGAPLVKIQGKEHREFLKDLVKSVVISVDEDVKDQATADKKVEIIGELIGKQIKYSHQIGEAFQLATESAVQCAVECRRAINENRKDDANIWRDKANCYLKIAEKLLTKASSHWYFPRWFVTSEDSNYIRQCNSAGTVVHELLLGSGTKERLGRPSREMGVGIGGKV